MAKKLVVCQGSSVWPLSVIKLFPRLRPEKVAPEGQQARLYLYRFQVSGFRCQEGESQNPFMKLQGMTNEELWMSLRSALFNK